MINIILLEDFVFIQCLLCCILSDSHGTELFLNKHIKEKCNLFELNICYNHDTGGRNLLLAGIVLTICNSVLPQRI